MEESALYTVNKHQKKIENYVIQVLYREIHRVTCSKMNSKWRMAKKTQKAISFSTLFSIKRQDDRLD